MAEQRLTISGPRKAKKCVILTHGAGESSDSRFLTYFADALADLHYRVVRFDFPYMEERSRTGRKRPPDRENVLRETWMSVLEQVPNEKVVIGGKSMGGRIASLVADESRAQGLICLGYPFHPTGKPEKLRTEHLADLKTPTLILQGENDPFGKREEVEQYNLSEAIKVHWAPDGDHSFRPRRGSDRTEEQNFKNGMRAIERFLFELWVDG
ncbi:Alpha/beta hydrolase family protein [Thalassoglobus neptunius]|uniref:Alpha/beta hydrolase family protein n=1 Tax=Thalassoglobus neptunius TaxID=1938619 RepID=A0A5C5X6T9_9PLAN|nr:alpha/beta fold hydrolase [Thalassoglobus neptunius]TWT58488.1 Alpha/beta hydrolase family protein [Thalassoglobus neptunius]